MTDNLDLGRPDTIEIIFNRQVRSTTESEFKTKVVSRGTEVTINAFLQALRRRPRSSPCERSAGGGPTASPSWAVAARRHVTPTLTRRLREMRAFLLPARMWDVDVEALRAETPGCAHRLHLNNAGAALLAQPTLDAMTAHLRLEAEIGGYEAAAARQDAIGASYAGIAGLLGGRADEVALFDNATHAWNAAFYSVPLGPGDRILTGRAEYGSNVLAYWQAAQRTGAEVVVVPNDCHGQLDTTALAGLVDERVKLIGVSHVPTSGGLVNPAAEIGRIARDAGVLFLLDATQSVGQFPVDVDTIGCDLLTATGRKFLRGPRGTGFLWIRTAALGRLDPFVAEIGSATWDGGRGFTWADGARRFESWEKSYVNIVGLGAAVRQALHLGAGAIGARTAMLGARLRGQLGALPAVSVHDLGEVRCAIVTARVEGVPAADVAAALGCAGINVSTTVAGHSPLDTEVRAVHPLVRFSPHYYNTEEELDRAVSLVAAIARRGHATS